MPIYKMELIGDYLFATIGGEKWLVDTGCPMCIGNSPLVIEGRYILVVPSRSKGGFDPVHVSEQVGTRIVGFLGNDVLYPNGCCIDLRQGTLTLGLGESDGHPVPCHLERVMGQSVQILSTQMAGQVSRLIFDTGAPLGYIRRSLTAGLQESIGQRDDYIGSTGQWHHTPVWALNIDLAGQSKPFHWGILPEEVESRLFEGNLDGVFGGELCRQAKVTITPGGQGLSLSF